MSLKAFPSSQNSAATGILLVGHGTRQEAGLAEFFAVVEQVRQLATDFVVESCFLEIAEPDIASGMQRLLQRGIKRIVVAPVLLFAAGHAKRDIPAAVQKALQDVSGIVVRQAPAIECQPCIVELSVQRFEEACQKWPDIPREETFLLMVGRGNSDPSAIGEMHRFVALQKERSRPGQAGVCFVAMAVPSLEEGLQRAAESGLRRIIVQPHLLFTGQVLQQIEAGIAVQAANHPDRHWAMTSHLGPSPLVAKALVELCRAVEL